LRLETLSNLHAQIQDAFNEYGVQIMSPHFMMQPDGTVVVPPAKWSQPPAVSSGDNAGAPQKAKPRGAEK